MTSIGYVETAPGGSDGRAMRYRVILEKGDQLYVEYAGYRLGHAIYGTPLGGRGWTAPVGFWTNRDGFEIVKINAPAYIPQES